MSKIVWTPEDGWHDGPAVVVTTDERGRLRSRRPNLSAACGAWVLHNGEHAHDDCTGRVALPPPNDRCECECHETVTK